MQYQSTVFGQLLKEVPRGWFERVAAEHHRGRKKRSLSPWAHLVTMVFVQLAGTRSLRDVERILERHRGKLAHLGLASLRRSTLSDANATRPAALFEAVAMKLSARLGRRSRAREALRLIDATRIFAGRRVVEWSGSGGIKLHVTFDPLSERPTCFAVTPERVNDITAAKTMPIERGATYVFDKGFYDFAFWARLAAAGCRFVTRLKKNSPTQLLQERPVAADGILFDRCVRLSERLSGQRRNPFQHAVRLIGVRIDGGREITLLTNDLQAPATQIAALYKARWQIELFFKWIKQNLKIAHFVGTSRNATTIQIMAALIAYLLLRLAQTRHAAALGLQAIARLMPATILSRRCLSEIVRPPDKSPSFPVLQPQLPFRHA
jgi:IS4 transposase